MTPPKLLLNDGTLGPTTAFYISKGTNLARAVLEAVNSALEANKNDSPDWQKFYGNYLFIACMVSKHLDGRPLLLYIQDVLENSECRCAACDSHNGQTSCQRQQLKKGKPCVKRGFPFCTCAIALTCVLVRALVASPLLQNCMKLEWYRIFSRLFLHQNFEHYLFANLLYLLFFGSVLERMYRALTVGFTRLIGHVGGTMMLF